MIRTPYFRPLIISRFFSSLAKQIQALVVAWQIFEITKSALALGFVGLAEGLPYVAFGLWAGHVVDRYEKKRILVISQWGMLFCSVGLYFLSRQPSIPILPIYILLGISSVASSYEQPASSSYLQMLIPREVFSKAAALNLTQYQIATISGPIIGGIILSHTNAATAHAVVCVLFLISITFTSMLKPMHSTRQGVQESTIQSILTGIRFLKTKPIIYACMLLDMLAVLFGDVIAILPVFSLMLGAGPLGLGFLRAAPAMGSCITSLLEASRSFIHIKFKVLLRVVIVFGLSIIVFGISKNIYLSIFCLAISGLVDGMSVIIRQSIYQAHTPDDLRGRVAATSGVFIRVSNELGGFESGLAAYLLGPVPSVLFGGIMTLLVAGVMWKKFGKVDEAV